MSVSISLAGRTFGNGTRDGNGSLWKMAIPDGWDAPLFRHEDGSPTFRPGAYESQALHGARALRCSGLVRCTTEAHAWEVYNLLPTLSPVGADVALVVHEPGGDKALAVRQADKPDIRRPEGNVVFFELSLKALYPYKRATSPVVFTIAAGATASFTHAGTFAAEMEIATTGSGTVALTSYGALQGTGSTSVGSGTVMTSGYGFANPARTVLSSGGANLYNALIPENHWLAVPPGANSIHNGGTAPVQITYYPTWE